MPITTDRNERSILWRKIAWFAGLWLAGVVTVGIVAGALRWMLHAG